MAKKTISGYAKGGTINIKDEGNFQENDRLVQRTHHAIALPRLNNGPIHQNSEPIARRVRRTADRR